MFATLFHRIKFDSTYRAFGSLRQYDVISRWHWRLTGMLTEFLRPGPPPPPSPLVIPAPSSINLSFMLFQTGGNILRDLKDRKIITLDFHRKLYPSVDQPPRFYGLPKVHKNNTPLRPIRTITYECAKYVADVLSLLMGKTEHHLKTPRNLQNMWSRWKWAQEKN